MSDRVLICTSFPPAWGELAALTNATQQRWADRHGYTYVADCSERMWPARSPEWGAKADGLMPIRTFIKLDMLVHFLGNGEYDWVVWLDCDQVVTNYEIPITRWTDEISPYSRERGDGTTGADVIMPYDYNGNNSTTIIARNTDAAYNYLWSSNDAGRTMFLRHDWAEMESMLRFRLAPPFDGIVHAVSAKELCALHPGAYAPLPPRRTGAYEWAPGDFSVHLAALPMAKRIELARHYVDSLNLL